MDYQTFKYLMDRMPYIEKMKAKSNCYVFIIIQQEDIEYIKKNVTFMTSLNKYAFEKLKVGIVFYFGNYIIRGVDDSNYSGQFYDKFDQLIATYSHKATDVYNSMKDFISDLVKNAGNPIIT